MTPAQTPAPDASLIDSQGQPVRLSQIWHAGPAVLVFYPGDFTKVCTAQLCDYRDRWADFTSSGATVVGINPAAWQQHARFKAEHHFPFMVLSDPDGSCCRAYLAKAWWGTRRMVVVVDQTGIERWRKSVMPFTRQSADAVLAAVRLARTPANP